MLLKTLSGQPRAQIIKTRHMLAWFLKIVSACTLDVCTCLCAGVSTPEGEVLLQEMDLDWILDCME